MHLVTRLRASIVFIVLAAQRCSARECVRMRYAIADIHTTGLLIIITRRAARDQPTLAVSR